MEEESLLCCLDGLDDAQRERLVNSLPTETAWFFDGHWGSWAHGGQHPPVGDWRTWTIMGGRGFGKTRAGSEWLAAVLRGTADAAGVKPGELRIALVGATIDEARRVMVEGRSGLLEIAGDQVADWHPSRRLLRFRSGAEATLFSGASPDALRGPEHHIAWCDELAKWEKPQACWDMLQLGLRLGERPRAIITTTPRPGPVLRAIMASKGCVVTGGGTHANPHLPEAFRDAVETLYAGTRLGRQELDGELLTDAEGALWTEALLARCRIDPLAAGPGTAGFVRTLIGVDPPSGGGTCGIVACALDGAGIAHVLADHSVTGRSPEGWAKAVAGAAAAHGTTEVVAESNQGGAMVRTVLHTANARLRVHLVRAEAGKAERAAPVAHRFEAGHVCLRGRFAALEAQLCGMIAGGDYEGPGVSPDRADAMVWGLTALLIERRAEPRVRVL